MYPCTLELNYNFLFFFFNDTATTEIYTLSLHDALPINPEVWLWYHRVVGDGRCPIVDTWWQTETGGRSEEHTSELQSHVNLVCRLLLEKKKNITKIVTYDK